MLFGINPRGSRLFPLILSSVRALRNNIGIIRSMRRGRHQRLGPKLKKRNMLHGGRWPLVAALCVLAPAASDSNGLLTLQSIFNAAQLVGTLLCNRGRTPAARVQSHVSEAALVVVNNQVLRFMLHREIYILDPRARNGSGDVQ